MPKFLAAVGATAIIAFSIGFNMARYPIVWEMVGPSAHLPEGSNQLEAEISSQPIKPAELISVSPTETSAPTPFTENSRQRPTSKDSAQTERELLAGAPLAKNTEPSQPLGRLVSVPGELFLVNDRQATEASPAVQRLPPVYQAAPITAGRYAAEYPQSPIPIYPSTGMK